MRRPGAEAGAMKDGACNFNLRNQRTAALKGAYLYIETKFTQRPPHSKDVPLGSPYLEVWDHK